MFILMETSFPCSIIYSCILRNVIVRKCHGFWNVNIPFQLLLESTIQNWKQKKTSHFLEFYTKPRNKVFNKWIFFWKILEMQLGNLGKRDPLKPIRASRYLWGHKRAWWSGKEDYIGNSFCSHIFLQHRSRVYVVCVLRANLAKGD